MTARIDHVREHDRRAAEHAVFQCHALVDRDVVLDFDAGAHDGAVGDIDVLADGTPRAYRRPFRDMREMPDTRSLSDRARIVHTGCLVNPERPAHRHPFTGTGAPSSSSDFCAAARIRTTWSPCAPSLSGVAPVRTQSRKCWHSRRSGSVVPKWGIRMSPKRTCR